MAINVAVINLIIGVISKIATRPKTWVKEASAVSIFGFAEAIWNQYTIGGLEAIDPTSVAGLVSALWILVMRLYQKHKEV